MVKKVNERERKGKGNWENDKGRVRHQRAWGKKVAGEGNEVSVQLCEVKRG